MTKMKFESPDMTAQNIDRIAALFPNCITEMLDEEHSTQEHLEALRQTIALLEEIEQEITFRRADLNMLSKKLQREHKLFCSAKMIQTAIPPQSFSPQEAACFAECFSALGHTEAEQACSRLAFYQERFRSFLQQQEKAAQSRLVLAPKLGILLGLTAAILLF